MNGIGNRILEIRKKTGLSQEKFGELCGLSRPSIMRYETEANLPSRAAAEKIAEAANVSVDWLLYGEEKEAEPPMVSDNDIKFALFGEAHDITDEEFAEVKRFAAFVREKRKHDKR